MARSAVFCIVPQPAAGGEKAAAPPLFGADPARSLACVAFHVQCIAACEDLAQVNALSQASSDEPGKSGVHSAAVPAVEAAKAEWAAGGRMAMSAQLSAAVHEGRLPRAVLEHLHKLCNDEPGVMERLPTLPDGMVLGEDKSAAFVV